MPESFNDTFLGNANVPKTGGASMPTGPQPPSTRNSTGATTQADGTENMRADQKTKEGPTPSTPSGKDTRPAGVQTFNDDGV